MTYKYYSQFNQDQIINTFLDNKNNGVFVDIGAYDGITYSNSYFFEKYRNWSGFCFEPNPVIFKKLEETRKTVLINGGVSKNDGKLTYKRFSGSQELEMLSGFSDFFNEDQLNRIDTELNKTKDSSAETISINTFSLHKFLNDKGINKIDYCSIDTEGGEFEILKTIDFKNVYFSTLSIENNYNAKEVVEYMQKHGFQFQFIWKCDLFFINKKEKIKFLSKLKLSKYYINFHLKKAGIIYKALNFLYKTFISKTL